MNRYKIGSLIRISKPKARKLWGKRDMSLCPVNLRPGFPRYPNIDIFAANIATALASQWEHERKEADFDIYVRNFEYYNCTCEETGFYTSFYLVNS